VIIKPNNLKLSEYGISAREFATVLDVYNDGLRVSEVPFEGRLIDMTLLSSKRNFNKIDDLENFSFVTNSGENITLSQVADLEIVGLPNQIKRLSGKRVLSIQLRPNEQISLEESIKVLNDKLIKPLNGKLPEGVFVNISGAASELERTWNSMQQNVLIAIFVIFILLTILMKSFTLPLIVLVIVPSAAVGGIMALIIINLFIKQPLDMLTMLGFIILTGVVVNNSILMVEQTVWHKKYENLTLKNCIMEATKNRIRPIFMSTLTSLFGLTPLLLFPGAGSELYRGIGAVIFGGLTMSTLLTFFMIPPLLMIALRYQKSN
jgi:HAE1 family hydrophobic/amphiphilic exporter-1